MKYVDEFRNKSECLRLAALVNAQVKKNGYKIMEVCGTHTAAIHNFGLKSLLDKRIELISGPGCPVCVTSDGYLGNALDLLKNKDIILATYPDMLRVPVQGMSLEGAKAEGADIRSVTSASEALDIAESCPDHEVVFLGVGFETTAPGTALALQAARKKKIKNFTVYSAHKVIPETLLALAKDKTLKIEGFLLPGHVSVIIGLDGYKDVFRRLKLACVVAGFEPVDILLAILKLIQAINKKKPILENEYTRIVTEGGNRRAQGLLEQTFEKVDSVWRGLGMIPSSGLSLRKEFKKFDAQVRFGLKKEKVSKGLSRGCRCADVLKGKMTPLSCPWFAGKCYPSAPQGPCMVSREGTCRTYFENRS